MVVPKIEKPQAIGSLKAGCYTDPDVLFAKKEEMLIESRRMTFLPTLAYVVGGSMSITIVGAAVGIPVILLGRAVTKTIRTNQSVAGQLEYVNA